MPAPDAPGAHADGRVSRTLEELARSLASGALLHSTSPEAIVEAQVGLVLEHLDRERLLRDALLRHLLVAECRLETLVLRLPGYYLQHDGRLHSQVRDRLLGLDAERRQIVVEHERRIQELESQLLQLVSQRMMLRESVGPER